MKKISNNVICEINKGNGDKVQLCESKDAGKVTFCELAAGGPAYFIGLLF